MPKVNGIECLIKLKSDSRLKRIPVIIYSTTSDENEVRKIMMLGADDFISKAISFDELKKTLYTILNRGHSTIDSD